jgi:hypothetical protein
MLPHRKWANSPGSRIGEVVAGIVLGLFGALASTMVAVAIFRASLGKPISADVVAVFATLALIGIFCCFTSYRLITGRGRSKDRGLFSPLALRILGLLFIAGTGLVVYYSRAQASVSSIVTGFFLGLGCFYLAERRERRSEQLVLDGNDT